MTDPSEIASPQIAGIDAAVDPRNTGLAIAEYANNRRKVRFVQTVRRGKSIHRRRALRILEGG